MSSRTSRHGLSAALVLAACFEPSLAQAEDEPPAPAPAPEYQVEFSADRVEIEPDSSELALSGNVVVTVSRFRIESDSLSLSRGPLGLEVEGEGEVALCPCDDAPLTLGFQSATVAPPTDVLLEQPTVRFGSVPVLWLPYLWLRARDRLGLLPAFVEWRGEDGLLIGSGFHLPTGGRSYRGRAAAFDLRGAAYLEGGARVDALLDTQTTRTRVVWDHLEQSALRLESAGSLEGQDGATLAFAADALRGDRARRYPSSLDQASRRYDRAALSIGHAEVLVAGLGLSATDERGGPLDSLGSAGPRVHLGVGSALGTGVAFDAAVAASTTHSRQRDRSDAVARLDFDVEAPAAPLGLGMALRQRLRTTSSAASSRAVLEQGFFPQASLPLFRDYGELVHTVEPSLRAGHVLAVGSEPVPGLDEAWPGRELRAGATGDEIWTLAAGLDNALGSARQGLSLFLSGGFVGADELAPAAAAELRSDLGFLGLSGAAAATGERGTALGKVRLGALDGLWVSTRAEASTSSGAGGAQWLLPDAWESPAPLLDGSGVSLGGDIGIPWTTWLLSEVRADYDASSERLLALASSLTYRHPCGCLSAVAWAGQRVGRGGIDAWLGVDLLP